MSKIVFLSVPAHGHVNPTLLVVQELLRRGEQVIYYNTEEFRSKIEATGALFRPYSASDLTSTALSEAVQGGNLANATALILRATDQILPTLLQELPTEQPDLLMFDSLALWGKMAANTLGIPGGASISHFIMDLQNSYMRWREILTMLRQTLPTVPRIVVAQSRLKKRFGKVAYPQGSPLFPMRGEINLVFTERSLQPPLPFLDHTFHFVGPSLQPQAQAPLPFEIPEGKKVIYLSMGTIHRASAAFYQDFFHTFADYPAHFIVSVGQQLEIGALGEIPANFTVRHTVPQVTVLQHTDLFITHGGMNSVHEALYYGVPLVVIPYHVEQLFNARCVERQGAAVIIMEQMRKGHFTAAHVREALTTLMTNPTYRDAAQRLQQTLRGTGGYQEAATVLQRYVQVQQA